MTDHSKVPTAADAGGTPTSKTGATDASPSKSDRQPTPAVTGHTAPENARAFPPSDTVDVPNLPKAVKKAGASDADSHSAGSTSAGAAQSNPDVDTTKHSWADNTQPAPDKKNARSSIL